MPRIETTAYEYQPEEAMNANDFMKVIHEISDEEGVLEDIDLEQLKCDTGACPI